jgi:hypothetical protein
MRYIAGLLDKTGWSDCMPVRIKCQEFRWGIVNPK